MTMSARCTRAAVLSFALCYFASAFAAPADDANVAYEQGDYPTALRLWRDLADQGNAEAQVGIAAMYRDGHGVAQDDAAAIEWFRKAADQGSPEAQYQLALAYARGRGVAKDDAEAINWYRKAAAQGFAKAQTNLGFRYQYGRGVARDYVEAVTLFRKATDQGYAEAQVALGLMYARGHGVPRDDAEAVRWYRLAADQGYAWGQTNLGYMYSVGRGVARDDAEAVRWYLKATAQDFAMAQDNMGVMYRDGRAVAQSDVEAVAWFRKSAEQGFAEGQNNLGAMYDNGRGVAADAAEAARWYQKAAEQGNARAQTNLGVMYRDGRGVVKDDATAAEWLGKASAQGDARARSLLASIEPQKPDKPDLASTVKALVDKYEAAQRESPGTDADRLALAHEIIVAARVRERSAQLPNDFDPGSKIALKTIPPAMLEGMRLTAIASFRPDRLLPLTERKLAETLDVATLQHGLSWERSELAQRITELELDAHKPDRRVEKVSFAERFRSGQVTANDDRGRACAEKLILEDAVDALLPVFEAMAVSGVMAASVQQGQAMDLDGISRLVPLLRPMLRDVTRQALLADCLFALRPLTDAEFEQLLAFLHTEMGGRYVRGTSAAQREAMLQATVVFTQALLDIVREFRSKRES